MVFETERNTRAWLLAIAVAMLALMGCAGSAPKSDEGAVPAESAPADKHFLWKISDENSSIWILGSMHFADSSFYPMAEPIQKAFESSKELAVEINVADDSVSSEIGMNMAKKGLLPAGTRITDVLPISMWQTLDSICTVWNFPSSGFMLMRPWMVAVTLSTIAFQRTGIDASYGIDAYFLDEAYNRDMPIVELETAQEQIDALADSTSDQDSLGIYYLKSTLREIQSLDSMVTKLKRAWLTGNDSLFQAALNEGEDEESLSAEETELNEKINEKVYTNRNEKMVESLSGFLKEDRAVFVVVGAAHLVMDEDNIIEALKQRGFSVERY